MLKLTSM